MAATKPTVAEAPDLPDLYAARPPRIDYVVIAYRSARDLGPCLDAIAADQPNHGSIIVVDNASPDRSGDVARSHPSRPRVIASDRNIGFGRACNLAAEASDADVVFFVNPDARISTGATAGLAAELEHDPDVGAVGPRIHDRTGDLSAASAGFEPSLRSVLGHFLLLARLPLVRRLVPPLQLPSGSPAQAVDWVGGAALMVRSRAFREVGGFDPAIFLYMEDVDLCRRLRAAGWTIRYAPEVSVEHEVGGSQGSEQASRWFIALHRYVAGQRGEGYARAASAVASMGLAIRATVSIPTRPTKARRLARAARTAFALALGGQPSIATASET